MLFGLIYAPDIFQRALNITLPRFKWWNCLFYMKKCALFTDHIHYLWHVIRRRRFEINNAHIESFEIRAFCKKQRSCILFSGLWEFTDGSFKKIQKIQVRYTSTNYLPSGPTTPEKISPRNQEGNQINSRKPRHKFRPTPKGQSLNTLSENPPISP